MWSPLWVSLWSLFVGSPWEPTHRVSLRVSHTRGHLAGPKQGNSSREYHNSGPNLGLPKGFPPGCSPRVPRKEVHRRRSGQGLELCVSKPGVSKVASPRVSTIGSPRAATPGLVVVPRRDFPRVSNTGLPSTGPL
jgi:hypothetical protein